MTPTERDRMLAGGPYRPDHPSLVELRLRARRLTHRFNHSVPDDLEGRRATLVELFGTLGPAFDIEPPFHCDYGAHIHAGDGLFLNFGCVILDVCPVRIGERVYFGPGVQIYTAEHPLDPAERAAGAELGRPVTIGSRVWIGGGAMILPGVTIGDDVVIGAGSVVTRDVPAGMVAVGNPCRVIRPAT